jgi:ribosomal subunit interface protein
MQVRVIGNNIDIGQSLNQYVQENLEKSVKKYFEKAVSAEVHFKKDGHLFKTVIIVNEGIKGGIVVKANSQAGDAYGSFNNACEKITKQLVRYKKRITHYRRHGGGLKVVEPNYAVLGATKYVLPPFPYNVFEEMENEESFVKSEDFSHKVISEKTTEIEELSVEEAIMKMDLADLPALVFINKNNKKINVVYHRRDGNISWIDPSVV